MPKLKPETIIPTLEEDASITAAALSDPDAIPLTDEEWEAVKPFIQKWPLQRSERPLLLKEIVTWHLTTGTSP